MVSPISPDSDTRSDVIRVVAIIAAAGRGERLDSAKPKQLLALGDRSVLQRSIEAFDACESVEELILVVPDEYVTEIREAVSVNNTSLKVVKGGVSRQDSVANGFDHVSPRADIVVVHDAARPLIQLGTIEQAIETASRHGAAVVAVPTQDTVKQVDSSGVSPVVTTTLPRDSIYLAQTPQAFRREILEAAVVLGRQGVIATDEAALVEHEGHQVHVVMGDSRNLKITTGEDLELVRSLVGGGAMAGSFRVGTGYDLHRLVPGRPLIIGGVQIPFECGLLGHSDADVLCHAITDAILGAAGAGDIGTHFPDTETRWKDVSSIDLLRRASGLIHESRFVVENIDAVVIMERPKISCYVSDIQVCLSQALGIEPAKVSVKGKTNESIGEIGRGEAISSHAVALLRRL